MKNDLNASGRAFKFQFDLQIQKIKLFKNIDIPKSSYLEVIWRRGQKNISTKAKPEVRGTQQQIFFGQTLSMISTCFLNSDSNQFSPKDSTVSVVIYISGNQKLFGSININLCSVLNPRAYHERGLRYFQQQLNGRTKAKIVLKLTSVYLTQMMKSDQQSIGSGVHSNSYNNTSSYSITEQRKINDIPSKDTYSVLSYGGYGTYGGNARYSAKKQDATSIKKQDSAKKIQDPVSKQYGNYGYTQPNFYSKMTNEYNPSRTTTLTIPNTQNTASRIPRSSDSDQNRSNVGEQNSRLLLQQQTKRSKLQAEMTKNKVENDQLKNKLSEYVRQNIKLKEELKKFSENNDSRNAQIKKQNEQLRQRNYVMVNQIRQLKGRFDKYIGLQRDCAILKSDKQNLLRQNKQHEEAMNSLKIQIQDFKKQLSKTKDNETKLYNEVRQIKGSKDVEENKKRQYEHKIKDLNGQLDYYQNNSKSLSVLLREAQQKYRNLQNKYKNQQGIMQILKSDHNRRLDDIICVKDKEIKQLNEKLQIKNQQCTKYIIEVQKLKNQHLKAKDDKISELQYQRSKAQQQNDRLSTLIKQTNSKLESLQQQKNSLTNQVRNQVLMRTRQTQRTRQVQDTLNNVQKKHQKQTADLRKAIQQLQMQTVQLNKILSQKSKQLQDNRGRKQEVQNLMKQNLQLELQLKYKNDQNIKIPKLQQQIDKLRCKYSIQQNNLAQLNEALQKSQRQLKDKNRSYILECQKTKMLIDERASNQKNFNEMKQQLQEKRNIIFNGEKQVQQMDCYIRDLQTRNGALFQEIRLLQDKLSQINKQDNIKEIRALQSRNRQLQLRDSQKIKSIQNLHRNLNASNKQIKQLQMVSEQRYQQLGVKEKVIADLQNRNKELSKIQNVIDQQRNAMTVQKNTLQKKNEMIMQELYSYKKKFQQQKSRSTSSVHIRTSEEYIKIKNLQNQLQKKDSQIKKLQKQLMALQSQNINLNIQVMKKLEDITPQ